jgi:hypothetical protein
MRYRVTIDLVDDNGAVVESCTNSSGVISEDATTPDEEIGLSIARSIEGVGLCRPSEILSHAISHMDSTNSEGFSSRLNESHQNLFDASRDVIESWREFDEKLMQ